MDGPIAELAGRQHGVVSLPQLRDRGFGDTGIEGRLRRGLLLPIHRGVYAVGHGKLTVEGRWMAAVLAFGPRAVLSHRSAGRLWGLVPRGSTAPPEVTRPTAFRARPGIRAHQSALPDDEVEIVDGIPVTSLSRTLFDLAAVIGRRQLERAMSEAEVLGLTDRLSIPDLLVRYPRRRGAATMRALLRERAAERGVTRSELEERFAALIDQHGLPRPRLNASVAARGRFLEVDCVWRSDRLIFELDGHGVHGTRRAFEADRRRDRLLVAEGWRVIRVTWRQLRDDSASIASELRSMLRSGARAPTL